MAMEKFHFEATDGTKIDIPFFVDAVKRKDMKKVHKMSIEVGGLENVDPDVVLKAANISQATFDKIDDMSMRDFNAFFSGWMNESKTGES